MCEKRFNADLVKPDRKGALTYINVPFDAGKELGGKGRIKVEGMINGCPYRSILIPRGNGVYILPIDKQMQKLINVNESEQLNVVMRALMKTVTNIDSCRTGLTEKADMDVLTAIRTRRSIRKFSEKPVEDNLLYTILDAGLNAPSAKDKRPWHFIVIRHREVLQKLAEIKSDGQMIASANLCIAVCGDKVLEGMEAYLLEDCAAAAENMLLAAHGLGLGAVWCGLYPGKSCFKRTIEILDLPHKVVPIALIAIGHPEEEKVEQSRFDSSKIHFDRW